MQDYENAADYFKRCLLHVKGPFLVSCWRDVVVILRTFLNAILFVCTKYWCVYVCVCVFVISMSLN